MKPTTFTAEAHAFASFCRKQKVLREEQNEWWGMLHIPNVDISSYMGGSGCFEKRMLAPYLHCAKVADKAPTFEDFLFLSHIEEMGHKRSMELPFLPIITLRRRMRERLQKIHFSFLALPPLYLISHERRLVLETQSGVIMSGARDPEVSYSPLDLIQFDSKNPRPMFLVGSQAIDSFFAYEMSELPSCFGEINRVDFEVYKEMMSRIINVIRDIIATPDEHLDSKEIFCPMMPYIARLSDILGGLSNKVSGRNDGKTS